MGYIQLEKDADGIVELVFDQANEKVNKMGDEYVENVRMGLNFLNEICKVVFCYFEQSL